MNGFDWPALMRAGMRGARLRPAEFWALTPVELLILLGVGEREAPMAHARLQELSRAFPDEGVRDGRD